jgi:hypothetical protein
VWNNYIHREYNEYFSTSTGVANVHFVSQCKTPLAYARRKPAPNLAPFPRVHQRLSSMPFPLSLSVLYVCCRVPISFAALNLFLEWEGCTYISKPINNKPTSFYVILGVSFISNPENQTDLWVYSNPVKTQAHRSFTGGDGQTQSYETRSKRCGASSLFCIKPHQTNASFLTTKRKMKTEYKGYQRAPHATMPRLLSFVFLLGSTTALSFDFPTVSPVTRPPFPGFAPCNICGDGMTVTFPHRVLEFPGQPILTCQALQTAGLDGYIDPNACPLLPAVVSDACKCDVGSPSTLSPASASNPTSDAQSGPSSAPLTGSSSAASTSILRSLVVHVPIMFLLHVATV